VLDLYRIIFGLLIMIAELRLKRLLVWFSFLLYYIGLGLFYVFVGGLASGSEWYEYIIAIIAVIIGFTYCAVGCMCSNVESRQTQSLKADVEAAQA
jgi:COPI associated protein